jgi:hypothetical protein
MAIEKMGGRQSRNIAAVAGNLDWIAFLLIQC